MHVRRQRPKRMESLLWVILRASTRENVHLMLLLVSYVMRRVTCYIEFAISDLASICETISPLTCFCSLSLQTARFTRAGRYPSNVACRNIIIMLACSRVHQATWWSQISTPSLEAHTRQLYRRTEGSSRYMSPIFITPCIFVWDRNLLFQMYGLCVQIIIMHVDLK